jgi:hypothetical protein
MSARSMSFPQKEEWDFGRLLDGLSADEIKVCYHYEYARELPLIREQITAIRNFFEASIGNAMRSLLGEEWSLDTLTREHPILMPVGIDVFFLNYPEWPETPYLGIEQKVRVARIKSLIEDETSDEALAKRLQSPLGIENPEIWPEIKLVIPMYYTHQQLLDAFAAYLRIHFSGQGKAGAKRRREFKVGNPQGGATEIRNQRAALGALGVYRLRRERTAAEVLAFLEAEKGKPLYHEESAVNRAKQRAIKHIERISALMQLDLSGLPETGFR